MIDDDLHKFLNNLLEIVSDILDVLDDENIIDYTFYEEDLLKLKNILRRLNI